MSEDIDLGDLFSRLTLAISEEDDIWLVLLINGLLAAFARRPSFPPAPFFFFLPPPRLLIVNASPARAGAASRGHVCRGLEDE